MAVGGHAGRPMTSSTHIATSSSAARTMPQPARAVGRADRQDARLGRAGRGRASPSSSRPWPGRIAPVRTARRGCAFDRRLHRSAAERRRGLGRQQRDHELGDGTPVRADEPERTGRAAQALDHGHEPVHRVPAPRPTGDRSPPVADRGRPSAMPSSHAWICTADGKHEYRSTWVASCAGARRGSPGRRRPHGRARSRRARRVRRWVAAPLAAASG